MLLKYRALYKLYPEKKPAVKLTLKRVSVRLLGEVF